MSGHEFKPGDVATATVRGVEGVTIIRCGGPGASGRDQVPFWWSPEYVIDHRSHNNSDVTDARPLVVIDPENREQVGALVDALRAPSPRVAASGVFPVEPVVHAAMYRDNIPGTLCREGWEPMVTTVTDDATCRECRFKIDGHPVTDVDRLQAALRSLIAPPKPEVYSHLVVSDGETSNALCGKVWQPTANVEVIGRCPECAEIARVGWSA